jgi:hypothetical protein
MRYAGVRRHLNAVQRGQAQIPANVRDAANRLPGQIQAALIAMQARNNASLDQNLTAAEESLKIVEQFLGK